MKTLLIAALLLSSPAFADVEDDYSVCLVGNAVIALANQPPEEINRFDASLRAAHSLCEAPELSEAKLREIDDYVQDVVEMALSGE